MATGKVDEMISPCMKMKTLQNSGQQVEEIKGFVMEIAGMYSFKVIKSTLQAEEVQQKKKEEEMHVVDFDGLQWEVELVCSATTGRV